MKNELVARNIFKRYGLDNSVFENVSFRMEGGHAYGLVAPNGSGKTTLMKCITGTTDFTGEIGYNGVEIGSHFNNQIVYSPSQPLFADSLMKVVDYLRAVTILKDLRFEDVLEKFRRSNALRFENSLCAELSTGQKKLFQLFLDFLSNPEIILLDEPLNGLDHEARRFVISALSSLAKEGKIILISTHVFSDIESITDRFFIIKNKSLGFYEGIKTISSVYDKLFPLEDEIVKF